MAYNARNNKGRLVKQTNVLYLAVTADEYELPVFVERSAQDLADVLGVTKHAIYAGIRRNLDGSVSGLRYVKVEYNKKGNLNEKQGVDNRTHKV